MLPFVFALIFAVGLPLLPSSFYRAFHLPALKFNLLSARHAPVRSLAPSTETIPFSENNYSEVSSYSGGSSQYLTFSHIPDCLNDTSDARPCMSLTERQDYPQPSILEIIHAQLLYQFAEAMIIMALSFLVTAAFLPGNCVATLMDRLCTALLISRQFSTKVAFSSFLEDIFSGLHRYWKDSSVSMAQDLVAGPPQQATLEEFTDTVLGEPCERDPSVPPLASTSILQDNPIFASLDQAKLCSRNSASGVPSTLSHSTKVVPLIDCTHTPFRDIFRFCESDDSEQERPQLVLGALVKRCLSRTPTISETGNCDFGNTNTGIESLPSHLGDSIRLEPASILTESPSKAQEVGSTDPSAYSSSSCYHESPVAVTATTPNSEPEKSQFKTNSTSVRIFHGGRRRYKSDGIQVCPASCHLGDSAAPLPLEEVDVSCAFWLRNAEGKDEALEKEASAFGSLLKILAAPHRGGNEPERAKDSPGTADPALGEIVVTPEGELVVPASQRRDGSIQKEIRIRAGRSLREPLAERYRYPAARRRIPTWDPGSHEYSESLPSPSYLADSPVPFTPKNIRQRRFVHPNNFPASFSDNWRRQTTPGLTVEGSPSVTTLMLPSEAVRFSVIAETSGRNSPPGSSTQEHSVSSKATSETITLTVTEEAAESEGNQDHQTKNAERIPSLHATVDSSPSETETAFTKEGARVTRARRSMGADKESLDSRANQEQELTSLTAPTLVDAGGERRRPLQDITSSRSTPVPKVAEYLAYPTTIIAPTVLVGVLTEGKDAFPEQFLSVTTPICKDLPGMAPQATPPISPRKRKPSAEPDPEVLQRLETDSLTPSRRPRGRRSAPHLGKYASKQLAKGSRAAAQTPEGSKRRRMRTTSARGVENWNFAPVAPDVDVDRNGQIVLHTGTGWKGRSVVGAAPPQRRQKQPAAVIV
ncbi:hypothetical protein BC827DRAFT_528106 [Russula dissimulans]|nr:hypothetical protein BC827DRAFT_528106 [Russula dissimulans]